MPPPAPRTSPHATRCSLDAHLVSTLFSHTQEDLEFSVGSKVSAWDVKETLLLREEDESPAGYGGGGGHGAYGQQAYPPQKGGYGQFY